MALYSRTKARRSLIDTILFRALSQAATILGYVVLVRGMAPQDFGVFNLLYTFIPAISTVASLGLEQTLRRYQPEYLGAGNAPAAGWLVRFVAKTRITTNVVILGLILLSWNVAAPILKLQDHRFDFIFFCPLIVLFFQARVLQLSLAAHMLHRFSVGMLALLSIGKLLGYAGFVWFDTLTLRKAVLVDTIAHAVAFGFVFLAYRRHCLPAARATPYSPPREERTRLLRYGFFNNFNDAGVFVLSTKSDNFFIAALMDTVAVGVYSFYGRLTQMFETLQPAKLFDNVVQPLFFNVPPTDADAKLPRYFSLLLNSNLLWQWPILAYGFAYHAEIVTMVFGGRFVEYSWLLPMIMSFHTINVVDTPVRLVAQYEEKAAIILLSKVIGIYNVLALLVLLPFAGLYGAVFASGSAQTLKVTWIWWHVRHRARWSNWGAALGFGAVVWGGAVVICYALKGVIGPSAILNLAAGAITCAIAWLVFVRTPAISSSDRAILRSVVRGRESRLLTWCGLLGTRPALRSDM